MGPMASPVKTALRPEVTFAVTRGAARALMHRGFAVVMEVPLANGRRADILGVAENGSIVMVEVKSSREDFTADRKWTQYRPFCDAFYFAIAPDFPAEILPEDAGLFVADGFGGDLAREAPQHRLAPARRRAMMLRLMRLASVRLYRGLDPHAATGGTGLF
jgi:hypothetical protein